MMGSRFTTLLGLALLPGALAASAVAQNEGRTEASALSPLPGSEFSYEMSAHLLRRAGFGGTPAEIEALLARGRKGAVDWLVDYEGTASPHPRFKPDQRSRRDIRRTIMEKYRGKWQSMSRQERMRVFRTARIHDRIQAQALKAWWFERMVETTRPLEEKLTLFWHGHFTSAYRDVRNSYHMHMQNQLYRQHASRNFGKLVRLMARDPAMLRYLDNRVNRKGHPNENFARELLELFTMGAGNYTEKDIKEAARALTGWTFRENRFEMMWSWHDLEPKTFLGRTGNFDGDDIIDIILAQPVTARYIAARLFRFFAHGRPSAEVVEGLAATLRGSGYEIKPVLKQLFSSREFYSRRAVGTMIKSPVDLVVGLLRASGMKVAAFGPLLAGVCANLGQDIFDPPNVLGWPGGRDWITTSTLLQRYNICSAMVSSQHALQRLVAQAARRLRRLRRRLMAMMGDEAMMGHPGFSRYENVEPRGFDVEKAVAGARTAAEKVDMLGKRLLAARPSARLRKLLIEFLEKEGDGGTMHLHRLLKLIVSTPEFQLQ